MLAALKRLRLLRRITTESQADLASAGDAVLNHLKTRISMLFSSAAASCSTLILNGRCAAKRRPASPCNPELLTIFCFFGPASSRQARKL